MQATRQRIRLSPNETAVLAALAEGQSVPEIAGDWGVSPTVVYRNIDRVRAKLGARTTAHACSIWVAMQLAQAPHTNGRNGGVRVQVS